MGIKIRELALFFDERIPRSLSCEWDNDGVMVCADKDAPVRRILLTLDVTLCALEYANEHGCDTVISHHPLIFRPLSALTTDNVSARTAIYAVKSGINVLSYHTRLDALPLYGVNDTLADILELRQCLPFGPSGEQIGRIGYLENPAEFTDFCQLVKNKLGVKTLITVGARRDTHRVALLGGDGKDYLLSAFEAGADTFITGRCGYNLDIDAAQYGINVIEAGHYNTEAPVLSSLERLMSSQFAGFEFVYYNSDSTKVI